MPISRAHKSLTYVDYMSDDEITLPNAFGEADSSDEWESANGDKTKNKFSNKNTEEEVVGEKAIKKAKNNKRKSKVFARSSGKSYLKPNGNVREKKK